MSDAIDRAAKVIGDILQADPQIAHEMYGDEPDQIARALADAGLLVALPTSGDGCQCTGHSQDAGGGHVEYLLEYEPSCPEHSEHVWNPRTGVWEHADRAEGDGGGAEREPTVTASQLRAFARLCVDGGDMTPAAARMLDRIIDGDGRAEG